MSLAVGSGPFGPKRAGSFNFDTSALKPHTLYFEQNPKRVRAYFGGEVVADSREAKLLHETAIMPVYYFPEEDVRLDLMERTEHTTYCPFKGDAVYHSLPGEGGGNIVWTYPSPNPEAHYLAGHHAFYFGRMERWMEEEEELAGHPRDPYHRIDVLRASAGVEVRVGGETVAKSDGAMILFETGLPPRYYIPREDVDRDALSATETRTVCPYKGVASYYSVEAGDKVVDDVAWSYPDPLDEATRVEDMLCFYDGKEGVEIEILPENGTRSA